MKFIINLLFYIYVNVIVIWSIWCIVVVPLLIYILVVPNRNECFMWSRYPFHSLCCQRKRVDWAFYIVSLCCTFLLYWDSSSEMLRQPTGARDLSWYWTRCLWSNWASCSFCKSFWLVYLVTIEAFYFNEKRISVLSLYRQQIRLSMNLQVLLPADVLFCSRVFWMQIILYAELYVSTSIPIFQVFAYMALLWCVDSLSIWSLWHVCFLR